ncbi:hypothetical protein BD779DRAFT_1386817, partial [Infundibulicybe gibba]
QIPLTTHQRARRAASRTHQQGQIDSAVSAWLLATIAKADELAERFGKKRRYFLDLFLHGGATMISKRKKISSWNTWVNLKARQLNADAAPGEAVSLQEIHSKRNEYSALTSEEKHQLVDQYVASKDALPNAIRTSPQGRASDMRNVARNMALLMKGLKTRVGAEGFFCIVRSATNFHADPQWYFSTPELENYMSVAVRGRWDTTQVGARIEAFALAGSNVVGT